MPYQLYLAWGCKEDMDKERRSKEKILKTISEKKGITIYQRYMYAMRAKD